MAQTIVSQELKTSTGKTFLRIHADPAESWVYTDWIGYPIPENVAKGALAYLDVLKSSNLNSILNDNRNLVGRWDQSLAWVEQVWLPYAAKSGLKYFAHVATPEALSAGAASVMKALVKEHVNMEVFSSTDDTRAWLIAQHKQPVSSL